jgi:tape measure domain-containing protein
VAEVGRIQIEVDARQVDKTVKSLKEMGFAAQNASGKVSKYEKETKQATRSTNKMSKASRSLTRTLGFLGVGLGGLTFVGIARSIEQATTQLNNIEATMQVAAGSSQAAGEQIAFIREESERLGLFFPTVAKQMAQFSAAARSSSITGDELKMIFTGISEASRAMGLTAPETEGAMKALQQMMSKGKVSAEELRQQLGERMPGSIQIMAQALGVGTEKLFEMMEQGKLLADEVLPKFGREMSDVFGAAADVQANKIAAAIQRLRTSFFDLMAQDSLTGATDAIDELANIIGSDSFQKHFDNIVQMVSRLGTVIANNIDVIAALGVSLSGLALSKVIQLFAGLAKSIGVSAAAARTAIPALGGLAVALNSVKRSLLLMAGPAGAIVAIVAGFTTFRNASEETRLENSFLKLSLEEIDERMKNIKDSANEAGIATLQAMQKSAQPGSV